jgi:hypothetical protein
MNKKLLAICPLALSLIISSCGQEQNQLDTNRLPTSTPTLTLLANTCSTVQYRRPRRSPASQHTPAHHPRLAIIFDDDGSPDGTTALFYLLSLPQVDVGDQYFIREASSRDLHSASGENWTSLAS